MPGVETIGVSGVSHVYLPAIPPTENSIKQRAKTGPNHGILKVLLILSPKFPKIFVVNRGERLWIDFRLAVVGK